VLFDLESTKPLWADRELIRDFADTQEDAKHEPPDDRHTGPLLYHCGGFLGVDWVIRRDVRE
jgi:hypothetical protein